MSAVGDARKRLDESTARPESGPRACDGTTQGCIVKPCNSPVPCGGCCWCLGGCDVDPAPVAEPADVEALAFAQAIEEVLSVAAGGTTAYGNKALAKEMLLDLLARRDEKRDRETVGRVVERLVTLATERAGTPLAPGCPADGERRFWLRFREVVRDALAEIEGA